MDSDSIAVLVSALIGGLVTLAGHAWLYKGKREDTEVNARKTETDGFVQFNEALQKRLEKVEQQVATLQDEQALDKLHIRQLIDHVYKQLPPPPPPRPKSLH